MRTRQARDIMSSHAHQRRAVVRRVIRRSASRSAEPDSASARPCAGAKVAPKDGAASAREPAKKESSAVDQTDLGRSCTGPSPTSASRARPSARSRWRSVRVSRAAARPRPWRAAPSVESDFLRDRSVRSRLRAPRCERAGHRIRDVGGRRASGLVSPAADRGGRGAHFEPAAEAPDRRDRPPATAAAPVAAQSSAPTYSVMRPCPQDDVLVTTLSRKRRSWLTTSSVPA